MTAPAGRSVEDRLRAAVESSPSGLLMTDDQGRIVLVNREVERLFGYPREELLGRTVDELVPERFRGGHAGFRGAFMREPTVRAMGAGRDLYGLRKDGTEVPVEIGLTPVATAEGMFVVASVVDITARRHAEADQALFEANLRQSQKLEALGTLAGGIAHDFNNILAAIVGYAELARDGAAPAQRAQDFAELLKAAEHGRQIVEQILVFARRASRPRTPQPIARVLAEGTRLLRRTLPPSVEVRSTLPDDLPPAELDATAVQQVLLNLVTNAAQAVGGRGTVAITAEPFYLRDSAARERPGVREGPYVIVRVRDTGPGMPPHVRERAFEPFFTTKAPGEGTGLGLSIVHRLMRDHGGFVELDSAPGRGTTVSCWFPAVPGASEARAVVDSTIPTGHGEHILLVEDDPALARLGERRLEGLGYRVTMETDPRRALEIFAAQPDDFDAVVTDYLMPHMVGVDLARAITDVRAVPIVMLTGYVENLPTEAVRAAGVRVVATKPTTLHELGVAVHRALTEDPPAPAAGA